MTLLYFGVIKNRYEIRGHITFFVRMPAEAGLRAGPGLYLKARGRGRASTRRPLAQDWVNGASILQGQWNDAGATQAPLPSLIS